MKSEELATQWCRDHPDATLEQAFIAGLGQKMTKNKKKQIKNDGEK